MTSSVQQKSDFDPNTMGGSIKRKIVNPLLITERAKCNFDREEAYVTLYPEEQRYEFDLFEGLIKKHPEVATSDNYYEKTREERIQEWWKRMRIVMADDEYRHLITNYSHKRSKAFHWPFMFAGTNPMTYHMEMFTKMVLTVGSEAQAKYYLPLMNHWQIIGCYAQTELGHGSNVAGMETTATLDLDTDEFVVHSPTFKASKFWPGNLGIQCTHAVIFARLIVKGKDYGVQPFVVPVRSQENHLPLPGIEVGEIGNKLGYQSVDNGYLRFTHFRVPRFALLAKFISVSQDGKLKTQGNPRVLYQIMVQTRISICQTAAVVLHRSACAATRYAVCRRQFFTVKGSKDERQLIDYQLQMEVLGKNLSNAIALQLTICDLCQLAKESDQLIAQGSFKLLDILHHFSSGMKALATSIVYHGVDELRQSCGGAGFLLASGIADWWIEQAAFPTFEGVNVVMFQQSSRMLFKQAALIAQGKPVSTDFFQYLNGIKDLLKAKSTAASVADFLNPDHLQKALATRAAYLLMKVFTKMSKSKASRVEKENDIFAIDVNHVVKLHLIYIMYERARNNIEKRNLKDQNLKQVLMTCLANFAIKQLESDMAILYECGFFGPTSRELLEEAHQQTLNDLRPQMIALCELPPFGSHPTTIGNEYGDIYENQFETAKKGRLNVQPGDVPQLYHTHIRETVAIGKAAMQKGTKGNTWATPKL